MYGSITDQLQRKASSVEKKLEIEYSFKSHKLTSILEDKEDTSGESLVISSKSGKTEVELNCNREKVIESIKLLSICHECMPEIVEIEGETILFYQGPSPDESTLVDFAQKQGFEFCEMTESTCAVKINETHNPSEDESVTHNFQIHKRMEFSSDRKRMGVFFTDPIDGKHKIYIKGADSEIKKRLDKNQINDETMAFIDDFLAKSSVKGLRTLLYGVRILDEEEYLEFKNDIEDAEDDILNSEKLLQEVYDKWETEIVLLGGTAVEDKLQEEVPETLEDFRKAGIKVWMLTGDKMETAKNIGYSCRLLTENMVVTDVKGRDQAEMKFTQELYDSHKLNLQDLKKVALVIDTDALLFLTENPDHLKYFISMAKT